MQLSPLEWKGELIRMFPHHPLKSTNLMTAQNSQPTGNTAMLLKHTMCKS